MTRDRRHTPEYPGHMKKHHLIFLLLAFVFQFKASAQVDTVSNISDADKLFGLSKFWSEANYNFAFFDHAKINWDSTYHAFIPKILATKSTWQYFWEMQRFAALLKDGHTDMGFAPQLQLKPKSRWIYIENFDKHFIITDMPVQYKDKVPLGSELISVDGVLLPDYAEKELLPYVCSSTDYVKWNTAARMIFYSRATDTASVWHLQLRTPKGKMISYDYQFHTYDPKWARRDVNKNMPLLEYSETDQIAIVKLNSFEKRAIVDSFKKILPKLYAAKGVILDIRANGGGNTGTGAAILSYFTENKVLIGSEWQTRQHIAAFKAWGVGSNILKRVAYYKQMDDMEKQEYMVTNQDYWYYGDTSKFANSAMGAKKITSPLVVLSGNGTGSAAEDFLILLYELKSRAITMGQRTYGSTGQPLVFDLPGIKNARICTKRDTYPDGRDFVGVGIIPDIEIRRNPADVISGHDTVLDAAISKIKTMIK